MVAKEEYYFSEPQLVDVGVLALDNDRVEDALGILKIAAEIYPESWNAYLYMGEAYLKKGENELSKANFEKAKRLNPNGEIKYSAANKIHSR